MRTFWWCLSLADPRVRGPYTRMPPLSAQSFHFHAVFSKNLVKQEYIPVGCVPPACYPYLPACTAPGGVSGPGDVTGHGVVYLVWGVYLGGVPGPRGVLVRGGCTWSQGGVPGAGVLPPVNRMTDRCKNITLPQTSFAGGNNRFSPTLRGWCPHLGNPVSANAFQLAMYGGLCNRTCLHYLHSQPTFHKQGVPEAYPGRIPINIFSTKDEATSAFVIYFTYLQ